jgi:hypothetical protein
LKGGLAFLGREKFRAQQDEARQTAQPSENEAVDGPANKLLSAGLSTAMTIYHPTNMVQVLKWRWPASLKRSDLPVRSVGEPRTLDERSSACA